MNSNWRLPTRNELKTIYVRLHQKGMGGFASDFYWSSSEIDCSYVWYQYFDGGSQKGIFKHYVLRVRLVRDVPEADSNNPLVLTLDGKYFEVAEKDEPKPMSWYEAMEKGWIKCITALSGGFMDFEVSVKNKIFGDSTRIMSMEQIMYCNMCALSCAHEAARTGKPSTCGMWTVSPIKKKGNGVQDDRG